MNADLVLAAARDIVIDQGASNLTMRNLADRLGVAPNTIYSHYPNKAALTDAVLDSLLGDVEVPDLQRMSWRKGLVAMMEASRQMLLAHPDLMPLLMSRPMRGPNAMRLGEQTLGLLARGGIEGERAVLALRALLTFTFGWVTLDAPRQADPDLPGREARSLEAFSNQTENPRTAELAAPMARRPRSDDFEKSLNWLIDGITGT
jgi:AcrR family transcriptional regulator